MSVLGALPETWPQGDTLFCHGSPVSDVESFFPEPAPDEERLMGGVEEGRVVFGHTHLPFARLGPGGVELVNPGSVGMPFDGDHRAAYALLGEDGAVERHRVPYDHAASAAELRRRFGDEPWVGIVEARLHQARFDVER